MDTSSRLRGHGMRSTATHIYFWGSVLSNWHQGGSFSGAYALKLLASRLTAINVAIPARHDRSSQHIIRHRFNCGEQFMMACKAWLFDRDPEAAVLRSILASKKPADQKALGRQVPGFDEKIWEAASRKIVIASQLARAQVVPQLADMYLHSGKRTFVEGSKFDRIWGVGIQWNDKRIEDERNWKGENRLGVCHGLARQAYCAGIAEKKAATTPGEDAVKTGDGNLDVEKMASGQEPGEEAIVAENAVAEDEETSLAEDHIISPSKGTKEDAINVQWDAATQDWLDFKDVLVSEEKT